jgi:NlpC/P60 family putative phage cell wall peptidase
MSDSETRVAVLSCCKDWIDTPYRHQASARGAGTDCLGLIRGIWRTLYGAEPETPPAYTPDWSDASGDEALLGAARRWLKPITNAAIQPGDVMLFRMSPGVPCKHIGVLTDTHILTHAYWGRAVVESALVPYWRRRWVHSFAFPPLTPFAETPS